MGNWLYIPIIFILMFSIWLWFKHAKATSSDGFTVPSSPERQPKSYSGVTILTHSNACGAVSCFRGKRLLVNDAPALPVLGCSAKECSCSYVRHKDRRNEVDRRRPSLNMGTESDEHDHRFERDRRKHSFA